MANYISEMQVGSVSKPIKDGTAKSWEVNVSGTPTALSSFCWWDTEHKYGYFLDVTMANMTSTMVVENFVAVDTLLAKLGPVVTTGNGKLTLYAADNSTLAGAIKVLAKEA